MKTHYVLLLRKSKHRTYITLKRTGTRGRKSESRSNIENKLCFTFKEIKNIKHMYFQNKGEKGQKITKFCPKTTV